MKCVPTIPALPSLTAHPWPKLITLMDTIGHSLATGVLRHAGYSFFIMFTFSWSLGVFVIFPIGMHWDENYVLFQLPSAHCRAIKLISSASLKCAEYYSFYKTLGYLFYWGPISFKLPKVLVNMELFGIRDPGRRGKAGELLPDVYHLQQ